MRYQESIRCASLSYTSVNCATKLLSTTLRILIWVFHWSLWDCTTCFPCWNFNVDNLLYNFVTFSVEYDHRLSGNFLYLTVYLSPIQLFLNNLHFLLQKLLIYFTFIDIWLLHYFSLPTPLPPISCTATSTNIFHSFQHHISANVLYTFIYRLFVYLYIFYYLWNTYLYLSETKLAYLERKPSYLINGTWSPYFDSVIWNLLENYLLIQL